VAQLTELCRRICPRTPFQQHNSDPGQETPLPHQRKVSAAKMSIINKCCAHVHLQLMQKRRDRSIEVTFTKTHQTLPPKIF